jgi:hypothetical protein
MNKYKVGDRVRTIPYKDISDKSQGPTFVYKMKYLCDKEYIVTKVSSNSEKDYIAYRLKEDDDGYDVDHFWWDERWLEPVITLLPEELFEI